MKKLLLSISFLVCAGNLIAADKNLDWSFEKIIEWPNYIQPSGIVFETNLNPEEVAGYIKDYFAQYDSSEINKIVFIGYSVNDYGDNQYRGILYEESFNGISGPLKIEICLWKKSPDSNMHQLEIRRRSGCGLKYNRHLVQLLASLSSRSIQSIEDDEIAKQKKLESSYPFNPNT